MQASIIVGHGEAKAMATKQKACRAITKKELAYLLSIPCTVDATTMQSSPRSKQPSCATICGRCNAALAQLLADPPGIALAV